MLGLFDEYAMAQLQSRCSGGVSNPAASIKVFEDKFSAEIASTFYERHIKPMVLDGKGLSAQVFEAVTVAEYVVCDPQPTAESSGVPPPFGCVLCGQMKRVFPKNGLVSFEVSHTHIAQTLPPMTHGVRFFCCASHACFITMVYDVTHFLNHFKKALSQATAAQQQSLASFEELVGGDGAGFAKKPLDKWKPTPKTKHLPPVVEVVYGFRKFLEKVLHIMNMAPLEEDFKNDN
jgi:hypothetical protein